MRLYLESTEKFSIISIRIDDDNIDRKCDKIEKERNHQHNIFVDLNCKYTTSIVLEELEKRGMRKIMGPGVGDDAVTPPESCTFQFAEYERIDWQKVLSGRLRASSYCIRKGLSRKAQLAKYTKKYIDAVTMKKGSNECRYLQRAIPKTIVIDTWSAFTVDTNALDCNTGLSLKQRIRSCLNVVGEAMVSNEFRSWILKPSTMNKGVGIQIVHCIEEVEEALLDEKDIREWVLQLYIDNPLLLRRRKFHIRAYVLAVSSIKVYFYNDVLILCSGTKYTHDTSNIFAHITNTAYQSIDPNFSEEKCVLLLNDLQRILVKDNICKSSEDAKVITESLLSKMQNITGELFAAYRTEVGVFAPIEGKYRDSLYRHLSKYYTNVNNFTLRLLRTLWSRLSC